MPISELEKYLENKTSKRFINQTFTDFRQDLLKYANTFYKDNIVDFSEVSLGGMLLDFAAIVGDSLVYYSEQQFNELDYETAVDPENINKHLRRANIKNSKASPSSTMITFEIEVDVDINSDIENPKPNQQHLPIIKKGTILSSESGINFILQEDVDFSDGYTQLIGEENLNGSIATLFLSKKGLCVSGDIFEEVISFDNANSQFYLSTSLEKDNITNIISVVDNENNEYHEVEYLTQSTVFQKVKDSNDNYVTIKPAPYRFIREEIFDTGRTILRFGNGSGKSVKDNAFSNPEDLLLPLKGKDTQNRVDLDPSLLLESNTLGISPAGKTLLIKYKHGGGTSHNLPANSINQIVGQPIFTFPNFQGIINDTDKNQIILSLSVTNENRSVGGTPPPTIDELRQKIPTTIKAQSRIITYEDLMSRILTMPSEFGRVSQVAALDNKFSASSKDLYVTCKDNDGFYVEASDAVKENISKYLNEFRLIGDNYNILDVPVFNFGLSIKIRTKAGHDVESIILDVNSKIIEKMRFDLYKIGTPINVNEIAKCIESTEGVELLVTPRKLIVVSKSIEDAFFDINSSSSKSYNISNFNPVVLYKDGIIHPPRGGIFEMRYTFNDIKISAN
tara:strand:- start:1708 stop:3570 length:1863 start_codon:yes stop_codon:yes gene_type:complete